MINTKGLSYGTNIFLINKKNRKVILVRMHDSTYNPALNDRMPSVGFEP